MAVLDELMIRIGADTKQAERRIGSLERTVDKHMGKIVALGAAAGAGLGVTFAEALEQEASSDLLAAQLDLTTAESERVGGIAGELFAEAYGENIGEVNTALRGIIAQTGELGDVTDDELSDLGANALSLAKILETDVTRAVRVAGQAVTEGLADDMGEAFDLITTASQKTMPGLVEEVLDAADEYSQFFRTLGFDGERAFGLLAAASEGGQYEIDKTGDALKEFTVLATEMSKSSVEAFDEIGLDAQTMSNRILAGGDQAADAFDKIVSGLLAIEDPSDRANTAIALFGTPLEDLSVQDIPEFLTGLINTQDELDNVAGAADSASEVLNDNASTAFTALGRDIKQDLIGELEPLIPLLEDVAKFIVPLAPALLIAAAAVLTIAAAVKIWRGMVILATVAQWAWNLSLLANPITWIVLLIVALIAAIVLLVVNWDKVVAAIGLAWDWLKEKASSIWDTITSIISMAWEWVTDKVMGALSIIQSWIVDKWNSIVDFVTGLPGRIGSAVSGMWDGIKDAFRSAINWIIGAWNGLSFTVPSVDMGPLGEIGGFTISTPNIPMLANGGIVTSPTLAMIGEGGQDEAVVPLPRGAKDAFGGGATEITIRLDGDEDLVRMVRRGIAARGGNVQTVLGS
ncbi:phage tail tape measure protein [Salininema proteolyticum]|uniref:Phage tail tape measure protein n=1 Tax=Salininema proteolyticum TaxID=1607685 RepID=A0ABV8TTX4_9ACTN